LSLDEIEHVDKTHVRYQLGISQLVWHMVTTRPDISSPFV